MNKNAIFNYVEFAREELQKLVRQKAFEYGITEKGAESNVLIVNGRLLTKKETEQRDTLIKTIESKSKNKFAEGYEIVMEEVSYTWFNRFIALRFMEVNGYLPSHTRVFSDDLGKFNPQILKEALTLDIYGIDRLKVSEMLQHNQSDELFKYLLILQCNALSKPMPKMFEKIDNYTELLFPNGLLKKGSIIEKLVNDIPEEDWKEQVQIIGWMYQFYVSNKRESYRQEKLITKKHVPTLSQIFTPDWIVRYMAENSIGRIWLESYPNSAIRDDMKYYVEDAKQEEDVNKKLEEIRYKDVEPEQIKIIEPCCGSGHILVYCFDLLYQMYLEKGYSPKDIATLILKNNLWGLDVDERAVQLAYFSVMMKARSVDRQYLIRDVVQQPRIYELLDSEQVVQNDYEDLLKTYHFTNQSINIAKYLVSTFKNGKVIGSLLKVNKYEYKVLIEEIKEKERTIVPNLMDQSAWFVVLPELRKLAQLAMVMSRKYDVMITNPPYLGSAKLEKSCKDYVNGIYPTSKSDLFSMFMEVDYVKPNGYIAMVNPESWMFLTTFIKFRKNYFSNKSISSMIHIGGGAFDATVSTTSFIIKNNRINNFKTCFYKILETFFESYNFYYDTTKLFVKSVDALRIIPSMPIAYWLDEKILELFELPLLDKYIISDGQNKTTNNELYTKYFWEIDNRKLGVGKKWLSYAKGGGYRKWYGNIIDVIDWSPEARKFYKKDKSARIIPEYLWNKEGVTWGLICAQEPSFRFLPNSATFDMGGPTIFFSEEDNLFPILGLLNSKVFKYICSALNPTVNTQIADIRNMPYIMINNAEVKDNVNLLVLNAKEDWDGREISVDFKGNELIKKTNKIKNNYCIYREMCEERFFNQKRLEEKNNNFFINLYELSGLLNKEVNDENISIRIPTENIAIKEFISYFIGVQFGRYSLDVEGLVYAGGEWDSSLYTTIIPDENNIIPILDEGYFVDDLMELLVKFISKVYGEDTLEENLKFISDALGGNGTSKENIRSYLISNFYSEHLKTYQKRPIYWLFDAGKQNSFKALIYMHRYSPDLLAKMRTDYILPLLDKYSLRIDFLEKEIPTLTGTMATKSRKELEKLRAQYKELSSYEPKIHHLADQRIEIDLDDGVKHNYELFKEVLAPIK